MNKNIITLAHATQIIEESTANTINAGNFETFADFMAYYRQHYKPLLQAIRNGEDIDLERRRRLMFLADDLIKLFHEDDEQ